MRVGDRESKVYPYARAAYNDDTSNNVTIKQTDTLEGDPL